MNHHLQNILNIIQQDENLTAEQKDAISSSLKNANKEFDITAFKLDRTEKVKRTTAILLEETIEELEQKRKAVEEQNRELEIESSLERVRTVAMAMQQPDGLLSICEILFTELQKLGFSELRNTMINIHDDVKGSFLNYDFSASAGKTITNIFYNSHPVVQSHVKQIKSSQDAFAEMIVTGKELEDWRKFRKENGEQDDPKLGDIKALYYYFYSVVKGDIGISNFEPVSEKLLSVLKRFSNVFDLAYKRYTDIKNAEAQARESQIQLALERVRARTMAMQHSDELLDAATLLFQQIESLGAPTWNCSFNIWTADKKEAVAWNGTKDGFGRPFNTPARENVFFDFYKASERGEELYVKEIGGKELELHYDYLSALPGVGITLAELKNAGIALPTFQVFNIAYFAQGYLMFITYDPVPEFADIFRRFAKVFEQTYTRFLDLQKAEAQAREAEIELALERVRARTMAMQHSDELAEASLLLDSQVRGLGIKTWGCAFNIYGDNESTEWFSSEMGTMPTYKVPREGVFLRYYKEGQTGKSIYIETFAGEACAAHYDYLCTLPVMGEALKKLKESGGSFPAQQTDHVTYFKYGYLLFITLEPVPDAHDIFIRFAKVFEQTYTRFLDLQKAEVQAREAQIQLALERVRARTMAMQKSDELSETAVLLFHQLMSLGLDLKGCGFNIWEKDEKTCTAWMTGPEGTLNPPFNLPLTEDPFFIRYYYESRQNGEDFWAYETGKEELVARYKYLQTLPVIGELLKKEQKEGVNTEHPSFVVDHIVNFSNGNLIFISYRHYPEAWDIFKRFGKVFEQTYTRFLDLQKAEAQAREAQIEASLERVRSKTMTMHNSQDVGDTVAAMFDELLKLGIEKTIRCGIIIINHTKQMEVWNASANEEGKINLVIGRLDMALHPALLRVYDAWKNKLPEIRYEFIGEDLKDYFRAINNSPEYPFQMDIASLPARSFLSDFFFAEGAIFAFTHDAIATETTQIFKRFAAVFGQTYRRYLDLLKAEAQAKEAQIEVSLERVRAQTMAMNKSQDLQQVVSVIFRELDKLDLKTIRCGIGIINGQTRSVNVWSTATTKEGIEVNFSGNESMDIHPVLQGAFAGWQKQEDFYAVLEGEDLTNYYDTQKGDNYKLPDAAAGVKVSVKDRQYYFCTYFPAGGIYFFRQHAFSDELVKLIRRFASAFSLAYKRFEDLKQSEARALEVIKESSLDRVRAETASMRTTADLERITPLIWNELTTLGVPFIRCGVFIIDESLQQIHTFLSTPDGRAIAAFHLPYNTSEQITQIVIHWQQNKIYQDHWDEAAFDDWTNTLVQKGIIAVQEQYHTTGHPTNLHLYFLPFRQGMLYAGSEKIFTEEEIQLVHSLSDAFSTAYARYEDFNKLELAKAQIEKALVDLKLAQTQLVQSEKMASLGELTAGIAHEIQNPLNFVNNFSEVNTELIEEMKEQLAIGNKQEAIEIANDIKENEQKINHHGKRADAIVKGMLQHSRTSTATKEPTDINKLADEYLRLAYHGLRAKDKSFNATLKTGYDETIEKIDVIPQDIGRVILNLLTNAFYAVSEKQKAESINLKAQGNYEPTVSVSTRKLNNNVEIKVSDNGNGIPGKIVDKIFQPFFTTKPTGQGTGLGLSLAYDIVKAHGGELKVKTKEGQATTFIIQLPAIS